MDNNFSKNLKKIRKENNLSQEQLAEELGVSRQAISKWESSASYPEMDKIILLCNKFNLNIDDLLHKDIKEIKGEEETKRKLNKNIDDFLKFITDTINLFTHMNLKSKIKCLIEQIIIIFILIIVSFIIHNFTDYILYGIFGTVIGSIFSHILLAALVIFFIIIFVHIFKIRYLDYYVKLKQEPSNVSNTIDIEQTSNEIDKHNKVVLKKNESKIIIRDPKHSEYRFIKTLLKLIVFIIKLFALFFVGLFSIILIMLLCSLVLSFLVCKTGIFFIGLLVSILSLSIIDLILILIVFNFVFDRKNDKKKTIWSFIISLVTLGIGVGLIVIGSLSFDVVEENIDKLKTGTIQYNMEDNLYFDQHQNIEYIESDIDDITLEYKVFYLCDVATIKYNNGINVQANCYNTIELAKEFISNLNNKKIISVNNEIRDIKVYASKENIEKLKYNEQQYYLNQEKYDDEIKSYNDRIIELENQVSDYENKVYELESELNNYRQY